MTAYLVGLTNGGGYLERVPYDGHYSFLAPNSEYATTFTEPVARAIAAALSARGVSVFVQADTYWKRAPEITEVPDAFGKAA